MSRKLCPRDPFDKLAFVRRSAFDTNGERKTVIIGKSDDFRSFAAFGGPYREAPFFAPVKEALIKASSRSSFLRACNSSAIWGPIQGKRITSAAKLRAMLLPISCRA